jgi:Tfp pilus assembly protein PilV
MILYQKKEYMKSVFSNQTGSTLIEVIVSIVILMLLTMLIGRFLIIMPAKFSPEERIIARQIAIQEMERIKQNPITLETQKQVRVHRKNYTMKIKIDKIDVSLYAIDLKITRKKKELFYLTQKLFYPERGDEE